MITIKEIIYLCKAAQLKNCRFFPEDHSRCPILVKDGVPSFQQIHETGKCLYDLYEEELDLYEDNIYYFEKYYLNEMEDVI